MKLSLNFSVYLTLISLVAGEATLSKSVQAELSSSNQKIPILVQLKPANLPEIGGQLKVSLADSEARLDQHAEDVFTTLTRHSESTKNSIKNLLEKAKSQGKINGYRSYYISNTIALEADSSLITELKKLDEVEEITSNRKVASGTLSMDGEAAVLAADLKWTGKEVHWSLKHINATNIPRHVKFAASLLRYGSADSGVDYLHPALNGNYRGKLRNNKYDHNYSWWDANKVANATKPNLICGIDSQVPCDDHSHGSHVMGTAVGAMNLGVSPTTPWMACKNMDQNFGSPESYLGCLQFFLAPTNLYGIKPKPHLRPHVVGNSYYCPGEEGCSRSTFKYALRAMKSAGIFMSVCAGNDGAGGCASILSPPAIDPNAFSVAATKYMSNARATFSSLGPVPERPNFALDLAAPGVNVTSSVPGGKYAAFQGTSMATPHVAGAALLIIAACPHLNRRVDLISKVLYQSATPLYPTLMCGNDTKTTIPNNEFGYGALNVAKALEICKKTWY